MLAVALTTALGWAGGILGLAGMAGAALAYGRSTHAKQTTELWKGLAEVALKKAETLEKDHGDCLIKLTTLEAKYDTLEQRYDDLKDIVDSALKRGSTERTRLSDRIERQTK